MLRDFVKLAEQEYGIKIYFKSLTRTSIDNKYNLFITYEKDDECIPGPPPFLKRTSHDDYKNRNKQSALAPLGRINRDKSHFKKVLKWHGMIINLWGKNLF